MGASGRIVSAEEVAAARARHHTPRVYASWGSGRPSACTICAERAALYNELDLNAEQLETLALNSFDAAFIDDNRRAEWKDEVRDHFAEHFATGEG